ncbi:MAG: class I SAM-dependent methyltransferase [Nitrososphaerales archaeon]
MPKYGLGLFWHKIEDALKDLIPVYDKVNRVISLGQDVRFRRLGIARVICGEGLIVLDAGCGPGTLANLILKYRGGVKQIILLDPIREMLNQSKRRLNDGRSYFVQAVFEYLPFRSGVFDVVVSAFALRDAIDLSSAISEIARVVKTVGGRLLIVDLGKPDNMLLQMVIGIYWRIFAPLLASAYIGRYGGIYRLLYLTYVKLPTNPALKKMIKRFFRYVDLEEKLVGGVVILTAKN